MSIKDFRSEQKRLRGLLRAWTMLREEEPEKATGFAKEAGIEFAGDRHFALSVHLSAQLADGSTLGLIATEGRLEPLLYCRDVITGLYALLFQAVVAGRPWAICLNCENVFLVACENKKFCRERCQQAFKQQRYRASLDTTDWREAQKQERKLIAQAEAGKISQPGRALARLAFSVAMFGLPASSTASRSGCSLRAVKITVASKIACFRSSVIGSLRSFRIEMR